jgi:hypothetical protein
VRSALAEGGLPAGLTGTLAGGGTTTGLASALVVAKSTSKALARPNQRELCTCAEQALIASTE